MLTFENKKTVSSQTTKFLKIKTLNMTLQENIFANALSIEELEAKFKETVAGVFSFLIESCCLDTQPPMPQGK